MEQRGLRGEGIGLQIDTKNPAKAQKRSPGATKNVQRKKARGLGGKQKQKGEASRLPLFETADTEVYCNALETFVGAAEPVGS